MSYAVEGDRFVLKILDKSSFQLWIKVVLKEDVQGFYYDAAVRRSGRGEYVAREENLRVASPSELVDHVVAPVEPAIVQQ
jgi:hypothetical protein